MTRFLFMVIGSRVGVVAVLVVVADCFGVCACVLRTCVSACVCACCCCFDGFVGFVVVVALCLLLLCCVVVMCF